MNETSPDELPSLLYSELPTHRAGWVIAHLLGLCDRCLFPGLTVSPPDVAFLSFLRRSPPTPEEDSAYEAAIDRAFDVFQKHAEGLRRQRSDTRKALLILEEGGLEAVARVPRKIQGLALFEALLARSWALRHEDPGQMIQYAWMATKVARNLSVRRYGVQKVADFECLAWAELGNADRVADKLDLAERAFAQAVRLYELGTGDKLLGIHLVDLQASLAADRRQFGLACQALSLVHEFHRNHGDAHFSGRALISKGLYTGYAGEPEEAIRLLQEGLSLLEENREPGLEFAAVHNQLMFLIDCGRFLQARKLLFLNRGRLDQAGGRLNEIRVAWIEGRIAAGLGDLAGAERMLEEVRDGFDAAGRGYDAALATLDQVSVLLAQGRAQESEVWVREAARTFAALRIEREALGAILMLRKAFEMKMATVALVDDVTAFLRRSEHDPAARFEPQTHLD
ncbi:MAG TPA: hypothetical protein VHU81_02240 [Thermoanaerobaculia bacterium]|nr:hypothetical protein [Thermoanaerobaculia bacterium]